MTIFVQQTYLKKNVESKHIGVRYHCCQCEYAATTARDLKICVNNQGRF